MRKVEVCREGWWKLSGVNGPSNIEIGSFHGFSESGDSVNGIEQVAIVEFDSGLVEAVYIGKVRFIKRGSEKDITYQRVE